MNRTYRLLIPALFLITMLVGSVSAIICPDIPDPPYVPEYPREDIVKVTTWVDHNVGFVGVIVEFAEVTPSPSEILYIIITTTQVVPPTETVVYCKSFNDATAAKAFVFNINFWNQDTPIVAVYAWLGEAQTDRAPNDGFYMITSLSASEPNMFQDYEPAPVGGVMVQKNSLEILTPYIALAGLIIVSAVYITKKRKD